MDIITRQSPHPCDSESGFGIVENLVAIALITIALVGTSGLFINCFNMNTASRSHGSVMADMQGIVDSYRNAGFGVILNKFATSFPAIADGQVAQETSASSSSHANYTVRFTAIKSHASSIPEAVKITVIASHRRGALGTSSYQFETIVAQAN